MVVTCRNVLQLRNVYLDGELSPSLTAEVHAHLLQCPECQQQFEMLRACGAVIAKDHPEPKLDSCFAQRVVAALPRTSPSTHGRPAIPTRRSARRRTWRLLVSGSLPAAAAVLFFAVLIWPTAEPASQSGAVLSEAVEATEATGLKLVAEPALNAMKETQRAAQNLNRIIELSIPQAGHEAEKNPDRRPQPKVSFLDIFLDSFRDVLQPIENEKRPERDDEHIVRF